MSNLDLPDLSEIADKKLPVPHFWRPWSRILLTHGEQEKVNIIARVSGTVCLSLWDPIADFVEAKRVCEASGAKLGLVHHVFQQNFDENGQPFHDGTHPPASDITSLGNGFCKEIFFICRKLMEILEVFSETDIIGVFLDSENFLPGTGNEEEIRILRFKHDLVYNMFKRRLSTPETDPVVWYYEFQGWKRNYRTGKWFVFPKVTEGTRSDARGCSLFHPWVPDYQEAILDVMSSRDSTPEKIIPSISLGCGWEWDRKSPSRIWLNESPYTIEFSRITGEMMGRKCEQPSDINYVQLWGDPLAVSSYFIDFLEYVKGFLP